MKKLILSLTIAACAALNVQAEDAKPNRPEGRPEGRGEGRQGPGRFDPEARVKRLTEALSLTQEQQDKIKKIFEDGKASFEALKDVPQEERREKARELMKAQHEKVSEVLTPEQKEKFKEMAAKRERPRGDRGPREGGDRKPEGKPEQPR